MSKLLPPVEKLSLNVRKTIRDEWDSKKDGIENEISSLLGVPWKVDVNPNAIFAYAAERTSAYNNLGGTLVKYFQEGLIPGLKNFVAKQGPTGVTELNSVASKHTATLAADEKVVFEGLDIQDGTIRLLFNPSHLAANITRLPQVDKLEKAIAAAPKNEGAPSMSFAARHSIEAEYDPVINGLLENCQRLLKMPSLRFEPSFEENFKAISSIPDPIRDWQQKFEGVTYRYFESFQNSLKENKFDTDDMLQETFQEEVSKATVRLRVVEKLEKGTFNEILLKDGEIILQTMPKYWSANTTKIAAPLVSLF